MSDVINYLDLALIVNASPQEPTRKRLLPAVVLRKICLLSFDFKGHVGRVTSTRLHGLTDSNLTDPP
jgi:hypothetical protein